MSNPRIKINKKEKEWERLKMILATFEHTTDIKKFIASKARQLVSQYKKNPQSIVGVIGGGNRQEQIPIDTETHKYLCEISYQVNKPIGAMIDDFFISPLLSSPDGINLR